MTSSFRSGGIELAPIVDTYVPAPTEYATGGATELANILQTVNPNLIKFIGLDLKFTSCFRSKFFILSGLSFTT